MGDACELRQCFSQQRCFNAISRGRYERRDHVAMPVAEGDGLVAFDLLVTAEAEVVASFLRRCGRAIAMNDGDVKTIVLSKPEHRAFENGFKTAVRLPPPKGSIDPRVLDLRGALRIVFVERSKSFTTRYSTGMGKPLRLTFLRTHRALSAEESHLSI